MVYFIHWTGFTEHHFQVILSLPAIILLASFGPRSHVLSWRLSPHACPRWVFSIWRYSFQSYLRTHWEYPVWSLMSVQTIWSATVLQICCKRHSLLAMSSPKGQNKVITRIVYLIANPLPRQADYFHHASEQMKLLWRICSTQSVNSVQFSRLLFQVIVSPPAILSHWPSLALGVLHYPGAGFLAHLQIRCKRTLFSCCE